MVLVGLFLGLWIWISLFRLVQISDMGQKSYTLILLREPKFGDRVVFNYPSLRSPLRLSKVTKDKEGKLLVTVGEKTEPLNEDLVVGVLFF